jgi:hypothetical protein
MATERTFSRRARTTSPLSYLRQSRSFEENTNYLPALLEAQDLWMWDYGLPGGQGQDYPFSIDSPLPLTDPARLTLDLQGGSDTETDPDHHVLVFLNGQLLAETRFDAMTPHSLTTSFPASLLLDGDNTLRIENAGDTGSVASFVYLDRFTIDYPRPLIPQDGLIEGTAPSSSPLRLDMPPGSLLLDLTSQTSPRWLTAAPNGGRLDLLAQASHRYLALSPQALLHPTISPVSSTTLRETSNQADWIAIAPQSLLPALQPLVQLRQSQGLSTLAVSLEDVTSEFGHGESGPHVIQSFLAFAFHRWSAPSPRYVLLLGDASYDPKGFLSVSTLCRGNP